MALPKLETPTYKLKLPSNNKTITYRPFLVKEEKLLMMSGDGKDTKEMMLTMKRLLESCITSDVNIDEFTTFDVEYIFLALRSKSVGECVDILVPCSECGEKVPAEINLEKDIFIENKGKIKDFKIALSSDIGVELKYPTLSGVTNTENDEDPIELIISCIKSIYDDKTVHNLEDYTHKEVREFVEALSMKDLQKLQDFFTNMPKVKCKVNFLCPKCGHQNEQELEGISNFF